MRSLRPAPFGTVQMFGLLEVRVEQAAHPSEMAPQGHMEKAPIVWVDKRSTPLRQSHSWIGEHAGQRKRIAWLCVLILLHWTLLRPVIPLTGTYYWRYGTKSARIARHMLNCSPIGFDGYLTTKNYAELSWSALRQPAIRPSQLKMPQTHQRKLEGSHPSALEGAVFS